MITVLLYTFDFCLREEFICISDETNGNKRTNTGREFYFSCINFLGYVYKQEEE